MNITLLFSLARYDAVLDAADSCPVEAILVRDRTGAVLAPRD